MEEKRLQMSESFFLTAILAIVGGFLDAYSYLMRGHVFANAQTGNIVLFGVYLEKRNFKPVQKRKAICIRNADPLQHTGDGTGKRH